MVLSVIGWVLLGLLGLLVLFLVFPVVVEAGYRDGALKVRLYLLWVVRLTLFPRPPTPQKPKREKKPKSKKRDDGPEKEEKPKQERNFSDILTLVQNAAKSASKALRIILKTLLVYQIDLFVPVSAGDAAATAQRCGQVQAAVGTTRAVLENLLHLRYKRLAVYPDFAGQYGERFTFSCKVMFVPVIMLAAGFAALFTFLRLQVLGPRLAARRLSPEKRRALKKRRRAAKQYRKQLKKEAAQKAS